MIYSYHDPWLSTIGRVYSHYHDAVSVLVAITIFHVSKLTIQTVGFHDQAAEMIAGKWLQIWSEIGHSFYLSLAVQVSCR
jgi:hypothetical protein